MSFPRCRRVSCSILVWSSRFIVIASIEISSTWTESRRILVGTHERQKPKLVNKPHSPQIGLSPNESFQCSPHSPAARAPSRPRAAFMRSVCTKSAAVSTPHAHSIVCTAPGSRCAKTPAYPTQGQTMFAQTKITIITIYQTITITNSPRSPSSTQHHHILTQTSLP